MKSKESPASNLPDACVMAFKNKKHRLRKTPPILLSSVNPAKYKGWSCQIYLMWMHSAN